MNHAHIQAFRDFIETVEQIPARRFGISHFRSTLGGTFCALGWATAQGFFDGHAPTLSEFADSRDMLAFRVRLPFVERDGDMMFAMYCNQVIRPVAMELFGMDRETVCRLFYKDPVVAHPRFFSRFDRGRTSKRVMMKRLWREHERRVRYLNKLNHSTQPIYMAAA